MGKKKQKGYTLVELMVVIIIVLVLAGIAVPVYIHHVFESKKAEAYEMIDQICQGADDYFDQYDTFVGGTIGQFDLSEVVPEAEYFTYKLRSLTKYTYVVTAVERGEWAPEGAFISWVHVSALCDGDPDLGQFHEKGW